MSKTKINLLKTTIALIVYTVVSYFVLISSLANENIFICFLIPLVFGILSTIIFLYLFSHQDFFHFIKILEEKERKNEKKYLKKFMRFGKVITCILISLAGGPIFLALTVRFLFSKSKHKYQVAIISNIISTILLVAFSKGLLKIIL
jgi:hypothetical protein